MEKNLYEMFVRTFLKVMVFLASLGVGGEARSFELLGSSLITQSLPSISEKLPDGSLKHRVGGVLIYPGVVLSTFYHQDYMAKKLDHYRVSEEDLFLVFSLDGGTQEKIKIDSIVFHPGASLEARGNNGYNEIALIFFTPTLSLRGVKPFALMNEEESDAFFKQEKLSELWAIGARSYLDSELEQYKKRVNPYMKWPDFFRAAESSPASFLCPKGTESGLGIVDLKMSAHESDYLYNIAATDPDLLAKLSVNLEAASQEPVSVMAKMSEAFGCSPFLCARSRDPYKPRAIMSLDSLRYFCSDHFGYPLLWLEDPLEPKIVGLSSSIRFNGILSVDLFFDPQIMATDTLRFAPWIKRQIRAYKKSQGHRADERSLKKVFGDELEASMSDVFSKSQSESEHVVRLIYNYDTEQFRCMGTLIDQGVVLTAGHCLDRARHRTEVSDAEEEEGDLYVIFKKGDKKIKIKSYRNIMHFQPPGIRKYFSKESYSGSIDPFSDFTDLGLVFFEPSAEVQGIKPVALASGEDGVFLDYAFHTPHALLRGFTDHGISGPDDEEAHFRSVSLHNISSSMGWFLRGWAEMGVKRFLNVIIPHFEAVVGEFDQGKITEGFLVGKEHHEISPALSWCLRNNKNVCTTMDSRESSVAKAHYMCPGGSGSGVFMKKIPRAKDVNIEEIPWKLVGVNSYAFYALGGTFTQGSRVDGCSPYGVAMNVAHKSIRSWITSHMKY